MSLTGYLLVFDQRAYWATVVAININGTAPILGPYMSEILKVGPEFASTRSRASTRCTCWSSRASSSR